MLTDIHIKVHSDEFFPMLEVAIEYNKKLIENRVNKEVDAISNRKSILPKSIHNWLYAIPKTNEQLYTETLKRLLFDDDELSSYVYMEKHFDDILYAFTFSNTLYLDAATVSIVHNYYKDVMYVCDK